MANSQSNQEFFFLVLHLLERQKGNNLTPVEEMEATEEEYHIDEMDDQVDDVVDQLAVLHPIVYDIHVRHIQQRKATHFQCCSIEGHVPFL